MSQDSVVLGATPLSWSDFTTSWDEGDLGDESKYVFNHFFSSDMSGSPPCSPVLPASGQLFQSVRSRSRTNPLQPEVDIEAFLASFQALSRWTSALAAPGVVLLDGPIQHNEWAKHSRDPRVVKKVRSTSIRFWEDLPVEAKRSPESQGSCMMSGCHSNSDTAALPANSSPRRPSLEVRPPLSPRDNIVRSPKSRKLQKLRTEDTGSPLQPPQPLFFKEPCDPTDSDDFLPLVVSTKDGVVPNEWALPLMASLAGPGD